MNRQRNKELETINIYTQSLGDGIAKQRIEQLLDWNIRKAYFYKTLFYVFSVAIIVINAIIPVVTQTAWKDKDIIISIMSAAAIVITSCLALFTMKDTWFRYRSSVENMKAECMKFTYKIGDYAQVDEELDEKQNEKLLVKNIEQIVAEERTLWQETQFNNKEK